VTPAFALQYMWASPGTLIGLLLGLTTRTRPARREGVLVFESSRGFAALHRRMGFRAITLGHVMIVNGPLSPQLWMHELVHVRQWEVLGPLMLVAYPLASIAGYRRNPFEVWARRRTGA
jgi:hypothetical protein